MNKLIGSIALVTILTIGGEAGAAGRTTVATVAMLQVWGTSSVVRLTLSPGGVAAPVLCDTPSGGASNSKFGEFAVNVGGATADGAKAMLATLTAAKLSGKPVTLYTNDGAPGGFGCAIFAVELN